MPVLEKELIEKIREDSEVKYNVFIESGTFMGQTIFLLESYFDKLYTVEIKKEFYDNLVNLYKGDKINFILGESHEIFINILPTINENAIFFLDGHWSAGNTSKGKKDVPIYEELQSIIENFNGYAIIIVNDMRLCGKGPNKKNEICDWEDISCDKILEKVKERYIHHYFLPSSADPKDRLVLFLNCKKPRNLFILNSPEISCYPVMIPVYTEFLSAFKDIGYNYKIITNIREITDNSIVFMSNNFHVTNPGQLLYNQAPNAIYIGWYWHEQDVSMLKRFIYTGENVFKLIPTHSKSFPLHRSVKNFVPLLLRTNEHPEKIGTYTRNETMDYCYMGGRYKADWVPSEPFKGLYHGVYDVKYYLSSEERKKVYLSSKYALGFQSQENIDSEHVSQRIFEGLAYGCLVFSESLPARQQTDNIVIHIKSKKDLEDKMRFYDKNPEIRKEIQNKGYEFSKKYGSNRYSMKLFLKKIKELFDIDL